MSNQLGFIVRGGPEQPRRVCDWVKAFTACAECATAAPVGIEAYLSMFTYPQEMRTYIEAHGSPKGYAGATGGAYVWLDFDGAGALDDTRRVCLHLDSLGVSALVFFSGSKGFHIGVPTAAMGATGGANFHAEARAFATALATECGAAESFDSGIYDRVRIFRAPNSRHPKSGLHKIALEADGLHLISEARIRELAQTPMPFDIPEAGGLNAELARRWMTAQGAAAGLQARRSEYRQAAASGRGRLNRSTLRFIREGASDGERAARVFQAAANLAECGAPDSLVRDLLEDPALDSGLTPSEVRRQIECGTRHGRVAA